MTNLLVSIKNALFKASLSKAAKPLYKTPLTLTINQEEKWCIIGSGRRQFIDVLAKKYLADPPLSVKYFTQDPHIEVMEFKGSLPQAHLSARYEYYKDEFDQTAKEFILDNSYGSHKVSYQLEKSNKPVNTDLFEKILDDLKLRGLEDRMAMCLSNGQMRRARLARALMKEPDLLIVDDPMLGLDPDATKLISGILKSLPRVIIGSRYQDPIPEWVTHVMVVEDEVLVMGKKSEVIQEVQKIVDAQRVHHPENDWIEKIVSQHAMYKVDTASLPPRIELDNLSVAYKGKPVLQQMSWEVNHGETWHIRGKNGTGKSTLISMITADHPQSWRGGVKENGKRRLTGHSNYFDVNKNIGISSPELHAIFPQGLTVYQSIATGLKDTGFIPPVNIPTEKQELIHHLIKSFNLPETKTFRELNISQQKLVLFCRGLVKMPDLMILDEAFSAVDDVYIDLSHKLLKSWPGTVLVIAHVDHEVPECDGYLQLLPGDYEVNKNK